ncbi:MAG TPA: hypothetical protein VGV09_21075 [Steroidobacteraceae bacterium]|nr:hypothetical protein [Steroidobacteraceae bacterium]
MKLRPVVITASILIVGVLSLGLLLYGTLKHELHTSALEAAAPAPIPPQPRLQAHAPADLSALRAQQESLLSQYAWLDAAHSTARIPIARAMTIYAQQQPKTHSSEAGR